jgi:thiol:disulfide interchange protein DsbD
MTIYGLVFAAPFVALSLFPRAIEKMPNSGSWMETLKIAFGFIEIAAAIKFLWVPDLEWGLGLLPRNIVLALFIFIGLTLIGYLLGLFRVGNSDNIRPFQIGKGRLVALVFSCLMLYPVVMSFFSPPTYHYAKMPRLADEFIEALVPPPPTEDELAIEEGWFIDQYDEALKLAKNQGKPLFIDFTGVYCANCRVMERRVFPTKPVKEQLDQMILTRLYVDKKDSMSQVFAQMQFERYQQATQPYYVIIDPQNESTIADTGGYVPNGFAEFLSKGLSSYYERTKE